MPNSNEFMPYILLILSWRGSLEAGTTDDDVN
jgi:hypothetical protein